ncbi:MAG: DUF4404 family protein [Chitinispirillaceae bacterium]|jgi:hypothetical protein|nr:DUF4404 family protein [Chitinispirillaceae bacterium]
MVQETISRIETRIRANEALSEEKKQELLALVGELKTEMAGLANKDSDSAQSVAGFAESLLHEAIREEKNEELLRHSLDGLKLSVNSFEVSHPTLVGLINTIGQTLWKMGI